MLRMSFPDFSRRSSAREMMDDFTFEGHIVDQTLKELKFINHWLGGDQVLLSGLDKILKHKPYLKQKEITIADIGCGGGDILQLINSWARKNQVKVRLTGVDLSQDIIRYAENNLAHLDVELLQADVFSDSFRQHKFDIITATLFCHHFTDEQLLDMFTGWKEQTAEAVLINDLQRHWLAYYSISLLTSAFSKSEMVKNDAPVSVLRAFDRSGLESIAARSGFPAYEINLCWAFRYQLILWK